MQAVQIVRWIYFQYNFEIELARVGDEIGLRVKENDVSRMILMVFDLSNRLVGGTISKVGNTG